MAVIAHHLILTGYGRWLPNDPRGSMSEKTWSPDLARLAENHFGRKRVQPSIDELRNFYRQAQKHLAMPIIWWDGPERHELVRAFGELIERERLTCYACAVLRNHAHLLVRRHRLKAEQMIGLLKEAGRRRLRETRMAPADHPVFSAESCHVFKSTPQLVHGCVQYVNDNYRKHKIPCVACDFVVTYDDWPFHKKMSRPPGTLNTPCVRAGKKTISPLPLVSRARSPSGLRRSAPFAARRLASPHSSSLGAFSLIARRYASTCLRYSGETFALRDS